MADEEYIYARQLKDADITSRELAPGALSADATGRAIIAAGYFDLATVSAKFAAASIADDRLAVAYIKQYGTRPFTGNQSMGGNKLTNLGAPTVASDAARLQDIQAATAGLRLKTPCRLATAAALPAYTAAGSGIGKTLTGNANGALSVDGVLTVVGDRVLHKDEAASHADHGAYTVTQVGSGALPFILTRATDFDENTEVNPNSYFWIEEGTVNADSAWSLTNNAPIVVDTTALSFTLFASTTGLIAGLGLTKTGNSINIASPLGSLTLGADSAEVTYATPATPADAAAATAGVANSALRSDAKLQVSTGTPQTTIKSDAAAAAVGTAAELLRRDAQLVALTAAAVDLDTANAQGNAQELARANHTHRGAFPTRSNKRMAALATVGNAQQATNTTIAAPPAKGSWIQMFVNGIRHSLADGDAQRTIRAFYISGDNGATARALNAIVAGDKFYWNGVVAGYNLATAFFIDADYETMGAP